MNQTRIPPKNHLSEQLFSTSDTLLVAWLSLNELIHIKMERHPITRVATFYYDGENTDKLNQLVIDYNNGNTNGNIVMFHKIYRKLLKEIKEGNNGYVANDI